MERPFHGFTTQTYGAAFADVYDEWYADISDIDTTVELLIELAAGGKILELGVGTGRLAIPLARAGRDTHVGVTGIDASPHMLARLRESDVDRLVTIIEGDMVDDLPAGPFSLVAIAYNTIFNLTDSIRQQHLFDAVAERLVEEGRFVVEAFVPDEPPPQGSTVELRSMTADQVVLSVAHYDGQRADGQFIELTERGGVRLRPWSIRYLRVDQLDEMAGSAGFVVEHRWADVARTPFTADSARHVTVYQLERH